ncbi:MAG: hypothetical protein JO209_09070 [Acidisphaera sp.]|nr:hypothetical protein [Acidisphaera sp.]
MAIAKSVRAPGDSSRGRIRVRSGPPAHRKASAETAEVMVGRSSLKALRRHKAALGRVLTTYAHALVRAERMGEPLEIVITVPANRGEPAVKQRPAQGDALDRALRAAQQRGAVRVAEIMKSPVMLTARAFGQLIGASHETVNQKRNAGEILALEGTTRGFRYPKWQVTDDGRLLPGLADLIRELPGGPWGVYRFLVQPHDELNGRTGLDALKANHVHQVLDLALGISRGTFT